MTVQELKAKIEAGKFAEQGVDVPKEANWTAWKCRVGALGKRTAWLSKNVLVKLVGGIRFDAANTDISLVNEATEDGKKKFDRIVLSNAGNVIFTITIANPAETLKFVVRDGTGNVAMSTKKRAEMLRWLNAKAEAAPAAPAAPADAVAPAANA